MFVDLIKHHWRYHRVITITYLGFLTLLLVIINCQVALANSSYYSNYYSFLENNAIDSNFIAQLSPGTASIEDIESELQNLAARRSIAKQAIVVSHVLSNVNLSLLSTNDPSTTVCSIIIPELTIGATLTEVFEGLIDFNMYEGNIPEASDSMVSTALAFKLGTADNASRKFTVLAGDYDLMINTTSSFLWYQPISIPNFENIQYFIPLELFLDWFASESIKVVIIAQHDRELLYSPFTPAKNLEIVSSIDIYPTKLDVEVSSYSLSQASLESFFRNNRNVFAIDAVNLVLMVPSIVTGLIFGTMLARLWYKQYSKTWSFFKSRGLNYNGFLISYILYACSLAIIAAIASSLVTGILENLFFIIVYSTMNAFWFTRFVDYIPLSLTIALVIAIWTKWRGVKQVQEFSTSENTRTALDASNPYPWGKTVAVTGIISLSLPLIVKHGLLQFSKLNIVLETWLMFFLAFFILITPLAVILGLAAVIVRHLPKLECLGIKSLMGINRQRFGYFVIITFAFQLFVVLAAVNMPNISYKQNYNRIGADYVSDYLDFSADDLEFLNSLILNQINEIKETWITTRSSGFNFATGSGVYLYGFNATTIPDRYGISRVTKDRLERAQEQRKVVLLGTGKEYTGNVINVKLDSDQNITMSVLEEEITAIPGFLLEGKLSSISPLVQTRNTIQLMVPATIELVNTNKLARIQFFSDENTNKLVESKLESLALQQLSERINLISSTPQDVYIQQWFFTGETVLFYLLTTISFILLFISEVTERKKELGPYLCRGYDFGMLRRTMLIEASAVVGISAVSSWVLAILLVTWTNSMIQFTSLDPFIAPVFPLESQVSFAVMVLLFIAIYYAVLRTIIRSSNLLPYIRKSN